MYIAQMNKSNPAITVKREKNLSTPEFNQNSLNLRM